MTDKREIFLEDLLKKSRVMVLSFMKDGELWSAPLYFIFNDGCFFFFSSKNSRHVKAKKVSFVVYLDSNDFREIKGIQGSGTLFELDNSPLKGKILFEYMEKYPESKRLIYKVFEVKNVGIFGINVRRAILTYNDPLLFTREDITQIL